MQGTVNIWDWLFQVVRIQQVLCLIISLVHDKQEPLRASISSQLRNSLQGLNISGELLEQAVQLVTNDNLDLGCAVIEQAATDKVPDCSMIFIRCPGCASMFVGRFLQCY